MQGIFIIQKIFLLGGYLLLGIVAPWWIFLPMIAFGIAWKQIGPEIIFITMILDMASGGTLFALWYSMVALGLYITIQSIQDVFVR